MLRRLYGRGPHDITLANALVPDVTLHYTRFKQITHDVDDARVYGGIHFRFDQEAGGRMGRTVATHIYKHNLRRVHHHDDEDDHDDEGDHDDERENVDH